MRENAGMESLDEFTLHKRLAEQPGVSLVLFTSPACGACRSVERLLPSAAPATARLFKVDVRQAQALARAYEVFHLPALFLFRDGRYHAALGRALAEALARPAQEEP